MRRWPVVALLLLAITLGCANSAPPASPPADGSAAPAAPIAAAQPAKAGAPATPTDADPPLAPAGTPTVGPTVGRSDGTVEATIVALTNARRQAAGVPAVVEDATLAAVAQQRSEDLLARRYFSHDDPETGVLLFDVLLRRQYRGYRGGSGENLFQIKAGYPIEPNPDLAERAVSGWLGSPSHKANLLNGIYRRVGIGVARSADGGHIAIAQILLMGG